MLNSKELTVMLFISVLLAFLASLIKSINFFFYTVLAFLAIIFINTIAKKITSYYLDSEIKIELWEINRYGFKPGSYFKKPFAMGIFFPIILKIISVGYLTWMACLTFDVKPKIYRAAKRHGLYAFSEMTEAHIGRIASAGIMANLIFALVGYLTGFSDFARLSVFYAAFNMIPLSNLDGNKIFFGNIIQWSFLAAITFVGLGYVFFLV